MLALTKSKNHDPIRQAMRNDEIALVIDLKAARASTVPDLKSAPPMSDDFVHAKITFAKFSYYEILLYRGGDTTRHALALCRDGDVNKSILKEFSGKEITTAAQFLHIWPNGKGNLFSTLALIDKELEAKFITEAKLTAVRHVLPKLG